MKSTARIVLFGFLAVLLVLDFYSIFNAGNPNSIFRYVVKDPSWDIAITVGLSLIIAVISLVMMQDTNRNSVRNLLEMNRDHILKLRDEGKSDEEIAESFTAELKLKKQFSRTLIKKKVLRSLKRIV
ncbi:MAG: hypothetical protein K9L21_05245 [Spirochaetia bacterium]|nr:hypothetical protein [Spirochaetia bacterium]